MTPVHAKLLACDRLLPSEAERCAYIAGDTTLATLVADAEDADDELDDAGLLATQNAECIQSQQEQLAALAAANSTLQADLTTAMDWMLSDKCTNLASCKELARRFQARLATIQPPTPGVKNADH